MLPPVLLVPAAASAWCQSLSVTRIGGCDAACLTLADFTPDEIETRRIVALEWRQPCVEWTLHPRGTEDLARDEVSNVIAASFAQWTSVECAGGPVPFRLTPVDVPDLLCEYVDFERGAAGANVILFAEDWSERLNDPGAFALTTTWFDRNTGEILGADMELNDERTVWAVCPVDGCRDGRVDLENVVVHELGHFFGLSHSPDDENATMWACAERGETMKRSLEDDDRAGWCAIYADPLAPECPSPPDGEIRLTCSFVGDTCDPTDTNSCRSGRCEDLGSGPVCTIPCAADPAVCPSGFECLPAGPADAPRCVQSGCGCRASGRGRSAFPLVLALAVGLGLRRRI